MANIFEETANQEKEHAKMWFKEFHGIGSVEETLVDAAAGENEEWTELYPEFAKIAREEGFEAIAKTFENISEVEKRHEARYNKLAKNMEEGKVFKKDEKVLWKCLNCGHIHEGEEAPKACPTCQHPQGYFEVFIENY